MTTINLTAQNQIRSNPVAIVDTIGKALLRYGLVIVLLWIGAMKFSEYEAQGIRPFVEGSPFMAWTYHAFGISGMSRILGVTEIAVGLLIATRYWANRISAVGSLLAAGIFLTTLSFLITTPAAWAHDTGPLALSVPGQFLLKDLVLLGAALWTAAEAWTADGR
jgi:uncharacterized membrane protein YkgB